MQIFLKDLWNTLFPDRCAVCESVLGAGEPPVCVECMHDLAYTSFSTMPGNEMESVFSGRIRIENATALLYFEKTNLTQELIHRLKYRGRQDIGSFLGALLAEEMVISGRFQTVDAIIPVPLHPKKLKKRGYNQLTEAGKALSERLQVPLIEDMLVRSGAEISQTHKNRLERSMLIGKAFQVQNGDKIRGKHLLLIDDVLTTGATLEACCNELITIKDVQVSLATLAYTPPKLL